MVLYFSYACIKGAVFKGHSLCLAAQLSKHAHAKSVFFRGVVHSFDGSIEEAAALVALPNIAIGVNGCSLKTEANLAAVATIPLDRLMLETDAPWCDIRPSHAAHRLLKQVHGAPAIDRKKHRPDARVKGRNEPSSMVQVLAAVAACRNAGEDEVAQAVYDNTMRMFFTERAGCGGDK